MYFDELHVHLKVDHLAYKMQSKSNALLPFFLCVALFLHLHAHKNLM